MNIFIRELRATRKSLIIWCVVMVLLVATGMMKYQSYGSGGQSMNELIGSMPHSLKALLGFGSYDVTKMSGYYVILFIYLQLAAAIHAALTGSGIIAKEERDKTTEFLMVKPVSRSIVITSKLSAALFNLIVFNLVTFISSVIFVSQYNKGESINGNIAKLMLGMFMTQLIFTAIGAAIAAVTKKSKASGSVTTGIMLFTYLLARVIDINDRLQNLQYLTPFKYFDAESIVFGKGFEPLYFILTAVIVMGTVFLTYTCYNKRDLGI